MTVDDLIGPVRRDLRPLHVVLPFMYPRALCGWVVPPNEQGRARPDTRGRDRCGECLLLASKIRRKLEGEGA